MLEACRRPDLVTEITLQPVRRHGVDAAILFSDIVVPLKAIGVDLDIKPGVGPVVARPIRSRADLDQLRDLEPGDVSFVAEAIGLLVAELGATPLIGFAGAPFTLASYLVEGGPSRNHEHTKALMYGDPALWVGPDGPAGPHHGGLPAGAGRRPARPRCSCSTRGSARCRRRLRRVGACRTRRPCWPRSARPACRGSTSGSAPASCSALMGEAGAEVVGVDFRLPLDEAARRVGPGPVAAGQPRPGRRSSRRGRRSRPGPAPSSTPVGPPAGTSSTWATASSPRPTPTCSPGSSTWCTPRLPAEPPGRSDVPPDLQGVSGEDGGPAAAPEQGVRRQAEQCGHHEERQQGTQHGQRHQHDLAERVPAAAQPGHEAEVVVLHRRRAGLAARDEQRPRSSTGR